MHASAMQQSPRNSMSRRKGSKKGAVCSHSARIDVPVLGLGTNMSLQLAHERHGLLLSQATSLDIRNRSRLLRTLDHNEADLSKAQSCGHCFQLTARLAESLLHHILFAKGQLPEPVSVLRKRRTVASSSCQKARCGPGKNSNKQRKEAKTLNKLDQLRQHLETASRHLAKSLNNRGEGPSSRPDTLSPPSMTTKDMRLLVVIGSSATMPRELFVLDMIQAIDRCASAEGDVQTLLITNGTHARTHADLKKEIDDQSIGNDIPNDQDDDMCTILQDLLSDASAHSRTKAREKTSGNWERKLVRLLVSDERLEPFLSSPLAPTRIHLFLSAPSSFRCSGWSPRQHLDFDLDSLVEPCTDVGTTTDASEADCSSRDVSIVSESVLRALDRTSTSNPLLRHSNSSEGVNKRWRETAVGSSSSAADSWPEDGASDHIWESSMSSVSEADRNTFVTEKTWASPTAEGLEDWLPCSSSPISNVLFDGNGAKERHSRNMNASRTGSSLGSSTVYGESLYQAASSPSELKRTSSDLLEADTAKRSREASVGSTDDACKGIPLSSLYPNSTASSLAGDAEFCVRRRSRDPKPGGLLSRNLLSRSRSRQGSQTGSDSSSMRSVARTRKRAPRCAGVQIDFSDPDGATSTATTKSSPSPSVILSDAVSAPGQDWCWFQCETVLEGFR